MMLETGRSFVTAHRDVLTDNDVSVMRGCGLGAVLIIKVYAMSYTQNENSLKAKIASNRHVARVLEWWSYYSAFVILPLAVAAFFGAAYLMFHDVL